MILVTFMPSDIVYPEDLISNFKDKLSSFSNDVVFKVDEISDSDFEDIADSISNNSEDILNIFKDIDELSEPLEKIGYKISGMKIELGLFPSIKFKMDRINASDIRSIINKNHFNSLFSEDNNFVEEGLSVFQKLFIKLIENVEKIEEKIEDYGYEIDYFETSAKIPPKLIIHIKEKSLF